MRSCGTDTPLSIIGRAIMLNATFIMATLHNRTSPRHDPSSRRLAAPERSVRGRASAAGGCPPGIRDGGVRQRRGAAPRSRDIARVARARAELLGDGGMGVVYAAH